MEDNTNNSVPKKSAKAFALQCGHCAYFRPARWVKLGETYQVDYCLNKKRRALPKTKPHYAACRDFQMSPKVAEVLKEQGRFLRFPDVPVRERLRQIKERIEAQQKAAEEQAEREKEGGQP